MEKLINKSEFSFTSSKEDSKIKGFKIFNKSNNNVKAVLVIIHGMIEHSQRYENFMRALAKKDIISYAYDHLGHKNSVKNKDELGFFNDKDGYLNVLEDINYVLKLAKKENPNKSIILMGHSMGSFFARVYAAEYKNNIDALIISGTGGSNPLAKYASIPINTIAFLKGNKHRSKFISKLTFGKFYDKIENPKTPSAWLTRDEEIEDITSKDEYCNFLFTLSGFKDVLKINILANDKNTYMNTDENLPIFIFSGEMDPVGDYKKGVMEVFNNYKNAKIKNLTLKTYKDARHEMINEINKDEVYNDVINWIENNI